MASEVDPREDPSNYPVARSSLIESGAVYFVMDRFKDGAAVRHIQDPRLAAIAMLPPGVYANPDDSRSDDEVKRSIRMAMYRRRSGEAHHGATTRNGTTEQTQESDLHA